MAFIIFVIIMVGLLAFLIIQTKNKSKFGINLKTIYCPVCHKKQPIIRIPANTDQAMFGGTTCPGCQTALDKYGRTIS